MIQTWQIRLSMFEQLRFISGQSPSRKRWARWQIHDSSSFIPGTPLPCGGTMKVIPFLTDFSVVDRIIDHLKLTFVADKPPPAHLAYQEILVAVETGGEYFS
jgi:hypothetical protein